MTYTLPDLDYDYGALAPHIAPEIMELHHDKHHDDGDGHGAQEALQHAVHQCYALGRLQRLRGGAQEKMGEDHAAYPDDDGQHMGELEGVVDHG